jgi:hypothetical protein
MRLFGSPQSRLSCRIVRRHNQMWSAIADQKGVLGVRQNETKLRLFLRFSDAKSYSCSCSCSYSGHARVRSSSTKPRRHEKAWSRTSWFPALLIIRVLSPARFGFVVPTRHPYRPGIVASGVRPVAPFIARQPPPATPCRGPLVTAPRSSIVSVAHRRSFEGSAPGSKGARKARATASKEPRSVRRERAKRVRALRRGRAPLRN